MKIDHEQPVFGEILMKNMRIGDVAIVTQHACVKGHTVVRTYSGWVSLNDPEATWTACPKGPTMLVRVLESGAQFTVTVEED